MNIEHRIWIAANPELKASYTQMDHVAFPLFDLFVELKTLIPDGVRAGLHGESGEYIGKLEDIKGDGGHQWSGADTRGVIVTINCSNYDAIVLIYNLLLKWEERWFEMNLTASEPQFAPFSTENYVKQEQTEIYHPRMSNDWGDGVGLDLEVPIY